MSDAITVLGRGKAGRALSAALQAPNLPHDARPDGLVIIAVPDRAIADVAARFTGRCCHLSGSLHLEDVPAAHPLVSFDGMARDFTGIPLAMTGRVPEGITKAFARLGFVPFDLPPEHKALYHATAVLTSGHAATLWLGAEMLLRRAGIVLPGQGLLPLAQATLNNVAEHGTAGRTGPFVRGDEETIARDRAALVEPWGEIFEILGRAPVDSGER
ncbi:MAG: DUF2520 domain-containing protein [Myxococcota bacterium]